MNPVTQVQPSRSVTAAALLTHTCINIEISSIFRGTHNAEFRIKSMSLPWCRFIVLLLLVVVEIVLSAPFLSFLLSSTLHAPSRLLVLLVPSCSHTHTHTQTVMWRSFRSMPVWNIQFCWIRDLGEEISLTSFGGHQRPLHMDIHTVHNHHYCWGMLLLKTLCNQNMCFVDFSPCVLALRLIYMLISSEMLPLTVKNWLKY